ALPGVQLPGLESERPVFFGPGRNVGHEELLRKRWMMGVCRASSSRKQSCPYGASITSNSTGLPSERSAAAISSDPDGGYSQSELNAISSVRAATPLRAWVSDPCPCWRGRAQEGRPRAGGRE